MSYTRKEINSLMKDSVPYWDRISGEKKPQINKSHEKTRMVIGKKIEKAVREGKIREENRITYANAGKKMQEKGAKNLAEARFKESNYHLSQMGKTADLVKMVAPGAGIIASVAEIVEPIAQANQVKTLVEYAQEVTLTDTCMKVGKIATKMAISAVLAPFKPIIVTAKIGKALALDAWTYLRG